MSACNTNPALITIKTGDTGSFYLTYSHKVEDENGVITLVPQPLDGYEIFIDFIDKKNNKIIVAASLDNGIILQAAIGAYVVEVGNTNEWPIGNMLVDILYVNQGIGRHSTDFILNVTKGRSGQNTNSAP